MLFNRHGHVPSASLPGWGPAGWYLHQAGLCITARHAALSWGLGDPTRGLGHIFGIICQRFSSFACLTVCHAAPSASSQPPRYLPKSQCPLNSQLAQTSLPPPYWSSKSCLISCFFPSSILLLFLSDLCREERERQKGVVPMCSCCRGPCVSGSSAIFLCSLAQRSSVALLLEGRDPDQVCSALLLHCCPGSSNHSSLILHLHFHFCSQRSHHVIWCEFILDSVK